MKKIKVRIGDVLVIVALLAICVLGYMTQEKDPAYRMKPATYYGKPAFTQLHRPQNGVQYITFYCADNADPKDDFMKDSKGWVPGRKICTVDTDLALEMYHSRDGYPKD